MKNGLGKITFRNGDIYSGDWLNDTRSGIGKINYSNGDQYEGFWRNNKRFEFFN